MCSLPRDAGGAAATGVRSLLIPTIVASVAKEMVMPFTKPDVHQRIPPRPGWVAAIATGVLIVMSIAASAQNRPPLQEPIATEGTVTQFYRAANVVIVKTMDGVEHVYHFTRDLIVHGGKKPGIDALDGLREGTTVVIHYEHGKPHALVREIDVLGDDGVKITEGVVTDIDRGEKEITIRFANGKTETLRMTDRAAAESREAIDPSSGDATRIVVYYTDEQGRKVAHYFRKAS
jgi:hypothetical protein